MPQIHDAPTPRSLAVPRLTRIAAAIVAVGVLVQAFLAGAFLAGRTALTDTHMVVGSILTGLALLILAAGLVGRQRNREPTKILAIRIGLFLALLTTAFAGMAAGDGARDLLMVHLPLAFIIMAMAGYLVYLTRPGGLERSSLPGVQPISRSDTNVPEP